MALHEIISRRSSWHLFASGGRQVARVHAGMLLGENAEGELTFQPQTPLLEVGITDDHLVLRVLGIQDDKPAPGVYVDTDAKARVHFPHSTFDITPVDDHRSHEVVDIHVATSSAQRGAAEAPTNGTAPIAVPAPLNNHTRSRRRTVALVAVTTPLTLVAVIAMIMSGGVESTPEARVSEAIATPAPPMTERSARIAETPALPPENVTLDTAAPMQQAGQQTKGPATQQTRQLSGAPPGQQSSQQANEPRPETSPPSVATQSRLPPEPAPEPEPEPEPIVAAANDAAAPVDSTITAPASFGTAPGFAKNRPLTSAVVTPTSSATPPLQAVEATPSRSVETTMPPATAPALDGTIADRIEKPIPNVTQPTEQLRATAPNEVSTQDGLDPTDASARAVAAQQATLPSTRETVVANPDVAEQQDLVSGEDVAIRTTLVPTLAQDIPTDAAGAPEPLLLTTRSFPMEQAPPPSNEPTTLTQTRPPISDPAREPARVDALPPLYEMSQLKPIRKDPPAYPRGAPYRASGYVDLEITLTTTGDVGAVEVLGRAPHYFSRAAIDAVRNWRFEAVVVDGKRIPARARVRVRFRGSW